MTWSMTYDYLKIKLTNIFNMLSFYVFSIFEFDVKPLLRIKLCLGHTF